VLAQPINSKGVTAASAVSLKVDVRFFIVVSV